MSDVLQPGDHSGTFRGNCLAISAALKAIEFWQDADFISKIGKTRRMYAELINNLYDRFDFIEQIKGKGLFSGLSFIDPELCKLVQSKCFENKLLIETCGPTNAVLKLIPPITIEEDTLSRGFEILRLSIDTVGANYGK